MVSHVAIMVIVLSVMESLCVIATKAILEQTALLEISVSVIHVNIVQHVIPENQIIPVIARRVIMDNFVN